MKEKRRGEERRGGKEEEEEHSAVFAIIMNVESMYVITNLCVVQIIL